MSAVEPMPLHHSVLMSVNVNMLNCKTIIVDNFPFEIWIQMENVLFFLQKKFGLEREFVEFSINMAIIIMVIELDPMPLVMCVTYCGMCIAVKTNSNPCVRV